VSALLARADALTLQRRPVSQDVQLPPDLSTAWREIVREQARRKGV
jgi:hypothetical protein